MVGAGCGLLLAYVIVGLYNLMSEHYPKSTVSVQKFCKQCYRQTTHAVSAGRLGHCLEHGPKPRAARPKETQLGIFTENK